MSKYIRIAVSALLLTLIAWRTDWQSVGAKFTHLRIEMWFAALGFIVVAQAASARRWQLFARELRFQRSWTQYFAYYFIGMYFNLSLPTSVGGDVVRVFYLDGKSGRKWAALASVFLERINGLAVLIALACVGLLITPIALPGWIQAAVWGVAGGAAVCFVSLPLLLRWPRVPAHKREQVQTMLRLMRVPRVTAPATFMSALVQVLGVVSVWCLGQSLGLDVPAAYYCILGPMVSLLTLLPLSVNGMGVREQGTILFLAPLGVDEHSALTLAVLWFAVYASASLLGGLVYLFGAFPKLGEAPPDNQDPLQSEGSNDDGTVDRDTHQGREGELNQAA